MGKAFYRVIGVKSHSGWGYFGSLWIYQDFKIHELLDHIFSISHGSQPWIARLMYVFFSDTVFYLSSNCCQDVCSYLWVFLIAKCARACLHPLREASLTFSLIFGDPHVCTVCITHVSNLAFYSSNAIVCTFHCFYKYFEKKKVPRI